MDWGSDSDVESEHLHEEQKPVEQETEKQEEPPIPTIEDIRRALAEEIDTDSISKDLGFKSFADTDAYKKAKAKAVFTRNMNLEVPLLRWLPGEIAVVTPQSNSIEAINAFCQEAFKMKLTSLMIYVQKDSNNYTLILLAFSCIKYTIIFDVRRFVSMFNHFELPPQIANLLCDPRVIVVMPGQHDWLVKEDKDLLQSLRVISPRLPHFGCEVYISNYIKKLKIQPSGKDVTEHMKLIHWLFQVRINNQMNGRIIPGALTDAWMQMVHHYGSLLVLGYWALEEKLRCFMHSPKFGVTLSPIYLDDILIETGFVTDMTKEELRKKLLGSGRYPDPPLPHINYPPKKN